VLYPQNSLGVKNNDVTQNQAFLQKNKTEKVMTVKTSSVPILFKSSIQNKVLES
jgi:hypothetical protein